MGIDVERFVNGEPPARLHCPICLGAAWLPHITCESEHVCCSDCFVEVSAHPDSACPMCRKPLPNEVRVSVLAQGMLEDLALKCRNSTLGCGWQGSIGDEGQHATANCLHRLVECALCHQQYTAVNAQAHVDLCPERWVHCPRGGKNCGGIASGGTFQRKDTGQHNAVCSMYCCANFNKCRTRTTKRNLVAHENACMDRELQLANLRLKVVAIESKKQEKEKKKQVPPVQPGEVITLDDSSEDEPENNKAKGRQLSSSADSSSTGPKRRKTAASSSTLSAGAASDIFRNGAFTPMPFGGT
ncbi:hypothetical protein JCM6882_006566 [Rhodosporidiobolus microsporus]